MTTDTAMTTDTLTILVPVNEVDPRRAQLARRPASLRGLRLAVLENGKPNSDRLLQALIADLETADAIKVTAFERKPAIGKLAPAPMIDQLVSVADVIITGVGDCAGCYSCTDAELAARAGAIADRVRDLLTD